MYIVLILEKDGGIELAHTALFSSLEDAQAEVAMWEPGDDERVVVYLVTEQDNSP